MRDENVGINEEKLGHAFVKARLISENQLKTALDYQRSLGGSLSDVIGRLGFLRPKEISRFLTEFKAKSGSDASAALLPTTPEPSRRRPLEPGPGEMALLQKMKAEVKGEGPRSDPNEELETKRAVPAVDPGHSGAIDVERALRVLTQLLVKKGVITADEEEAILLSAVRTAAAH